MASAPATEVKELELIGKVELRIAIADSDKKLENLLKVYLAPLLLKLASDSVAVRNKVKFLSSVSQILLRAFAQYVLYMYFIR